jgi:hypothetical protein
MVTGPLYQAVMNLIHALWIGHKEFVLNFLRSRSDFWDGFCAPLFQNPRWVLVYTHLIQHLFQAQIKLIMFLKYNPLYKHVQDKI